MDSREAHVDVVVDKVEGAHDVTDEASSTVVSSKLHTKEALSLRCRFFHSIASIMDWLESVIAISVCQRLALNQLNVVCKGFISIATASADSFVDRSRPLTHSTSSSRH